MSADLCSASQSPPRALPDPRLILLGLDREPNQIEFWRLFGRARREGIEVDLLMVDEGPLALDERMVEHRPALFVLCQTEGMTVGLSLRVRQSFFAHARPRHRLVTISMTRGMQHAWQAVEAHLGQRTPARMVRRRMADHRQSLNASIA